MGKQISVPTLESDNTLITVQPGTQPGDKIKLPNMGINKLAPQQSKRGNHFIIVNVKIPHINELSDKQKMSLQEFVGKD